MKRMLMLALGGLMAIAAVNAQSMEPTELVQSTSDAVLERVVGNQDHLRFGNRIS